MHKCKGLFTPSVSISGSSSEDFVDLHLSHTHQASTAAVSLVSKNQMGSRSILTLTLGVNRIKKDQKDRKPRMDEVNSMSILPPCPILRRNQLWGGTLLTRRKKCMKHEKKTHLFVFSYFVFD